MLFEVVVKEDVEKSNLKKGQVVVVHDVNWHKGSTVENFGCIFFLIYNSSTDRFIYEDQSNFRPRYADGTPRLSCELSRETVKAH